MGHQWITAACRTLRREERTVVTMTGRTRKDRRMLVVRVTCERGRLGATCLIAAYEQVVPVARRRSGAGPMRGVGTHAAEPQGREELGP
jgi:hypothetical protein